MCFFSSKKAFIKIIDIDDVSCYHFICDIKPLPTPRRLMVRKKGKRDNLSSYYIIYTTPNILHPLVTVVSSL